jgi:hypothetical protein
MEQSDVSEQRITDALGGLHRLPRYYPQYKPLSSMDDLALSSKSDRDEINSDQPSNHRSSFPFDYDDPFVSNKDFVPIPDELQMEFKTEAPFSGSQIIYGPFRLYESGPTKIIIARKIMLYVGPKSVMVGVPYDAPPVVLDEVRLKYPVIKRAGFDLKLSREKNLDCSFFFTLFRFKDGEFVKVNGYDASKTHKRMQGSIEAWDSSDTQVPEIITLNIRGSTDYPLYVGSCYVNYHYYVISPLVDSYCGDHSTLDLNSVL